MSQIVNRSPKVTGYEYPDGLSAAHLLVGLFMVMVAAGCAIIVLNVLFQP